jgi:hypothetical protein
MRKINARETEDGGLRLTKRELLDRWKSQRDSRPLQVFVPYRNVELAKSALDLTAALAGNLGVEAVLIAVHVVSPLLPLHEPGVAKNFFERKLESVAQQSALPIRVELVFAREMQSGIRLVIPQGSLVLVATRRHWWRTAEEKLARFLEREGHSVVLLRV